MTDDSDEIVIAAFFTKGLTRAAKHVSVDVLVSGMAWLMECCREVGGSIVCCLGRSSRHSLSHVALRR
jgi:hypothetical protein